MSGNNQDSINTIYSQHDDPQMLMAIAISKQINGSEESSENSVKVFLNRFIKKNQKNKTLSEVSINRFNILLYQVKSITLTVEDLVTLMEVIEIYSNNFENLAQYEELWPNLKISFSNILQFIKIAFDYIIQSQISENSQQIKRFIESVLIVFKKIFKIQKDSFLEYATVDQVINKIERSPLCEKLAQQKSEDTSYESAILVEDQSFSNRVIDLSDELIFAEDANAQKVQRVFRRFLSPNSEFMKEYTNLIVNLVKNSILSEYNQQLIILLSDLISNKKVGNASIIKNLSDRILPEVIQNPTCENFDIIILLMKGSIINEQIGKEQRLELFYNLIVGLGNVSIEKTDTKFEQLLQKINTIFKVYSENMKLQNLEKGNTDFKFLDNLFEVSYQFMSNMKKIQEAELHHNQIKKMEQINSQEKKMEVEAQNVMVPPAPALNIASNSKNQFQAALKPLNSDSFLEDSYVDEKSNSASNYSYQMENMIMRIQSSVKKESSQKQNEDSNKTIQSIKPNISESCEDILQKQFELIAKLSSFLFTIYKAISDVEFLNKRMSTKLNYDILTKLIQQINQFYVHYKQISSQLTKIILLFINSNSHFNEEFVKSYCSSLSHFLLRYKIEKSNNQINNHVISIYVKIYLSLTSQKKDSFKEDIEQVNKNILDFFIEGLFDVKNYHMLLLNLVYLNLNTPAEKEKMIKSILSNITVMNQNILILILLLYNLLVSSSYNIFENKFKNILMNLLQQKAITLSQNSDDSNQQGQLNSQNGSLSNQNSYSNQNQSNDTSGGMIDMCDPLNINNFLQISNQNVKKLKLPSLSGQSTTSIIASNISLQISFENKSNLIQLIKKLNQNIQQVLQNVNNLQVFYSLMIELNQIAQLMDPTFQKSILITNFEQIQQINAIKNYEGAISIFNETIALDSMNSTRDSQIFALLLRTNHLIRSNDSSALGASQTNKKSQNQSNSDKMEVEQIVGSENSNKSQNNSQEMGSQSKMNIEDDAQEIHIIHLALTNAINRLKLYQKDSQEQLKQVIHSIMNETQQIERDIMMCILKQDNLKTSDVFDKLNLSEAIYIDVLKFILLHCNTSIDTEIDKIIDHLKKNLNAVYITELLSIISQPLKYLDKDLSSRFTQSHTKLQQDLNQYVFSRMYVKELLQFIDVLFNYITKNISGKLKDFYNFDKYPTSKQLCEEVLILSVLNANVVGKSAIESIDTLFNSQAQKFTQYFKSSMGSTIQEYERLAFLLIINKFQKYSLQVELFNVIMKSPSISDFSMSVLNQIILLILAEIKSSPLNLKAFCIAFNLNIIPKDSVDPNLLRLCFELRKNLDLHNIQTLESNNILLDILLRYPNRQADLLLPFVGQKGVNLKEKLWFPISDLIKTCFQSSNVDLLYDLDSDYDYNNKTKSRAKMEKALSNLKKESARGNYKDHKIIQAIEKMNPEQFIKFDCQVQKFSYEMDKNLYYNTDNIANFKTLRAAFTQNFLQHFNSLLTQNRPLIQQFIRDCEISPSKITISESEDKNKVMKICFAELMNFFEAIITEGRDFDKQFVKKVLLLASEIIYTITSETYKIQNIEIGIIGYNTERIIQVSHFIFTNSINSIDIKDHQELIKELFNYSLFLDKLDNLKSKKYFIDILLLLILHIKQAEQEQIMQEKKKRAQSDQQIKDIQVLQQQQMQLQQAQQNDKMETEVTREQLVEDLDKKFNSLPKEVTTNICTLEKYQGRHEQQIFYKCHTCNIAEQSYVICSWCANVCHNGHDVMYYRQSSGTCDCVEKGPQGGCKVKLYKKDQGPSFVQQQQQSQKSYKFERYDFNNKTQYDQVLSQIDSSEIPAELLSYYLKGKEKEEKLRALQEERSQFNFEKKIGSLNPFSQIQDEQDEQYEEVNEEQFIEEEEKNEDEMFSSESDKEIELKQSEQNIQAFAGSQRTYMLEKQVTNGNKERQADQNYNFRFGDLNKFNHSIQRLINHNNNLCEVETNNQSLENSINNPFSDMGNQGQAEDSQVLNYADNQKSIVNNFSLKDISDMDAFLLNLIDTQQKQQPQFNMINAIMQLCEQQLTAIISNWESISSNREKQKSNNAVQIIDFISNIVAGSTLTSQMDNTLGKIVCRLYKNGLLDMRVREDQFSDNQYFLMQNGYGAQPVAPMIIRKPIDYNNDNLIVVTSGSKVVVIDRSKLLMRLAENIKSQIASNNEDLFQGNRLLQLSQTDISIIQQYPLDFTVMHVRFSPKNSQVIAICGLNQIQIWKISNEAKILKSISIQQKNYGEYINKILWLPNSEQYLMIMNLKSIRLYQVNFEGNSPLIMKFNANDQSGIFKDFIIAENPVRQNEFIVLVACADGRVYYQEFGTQQREDIIFTTYIGIPQEYVPKGQVCMGISYSPYSNIMTLSYKNGVNIFGKLDIKTHRLTNCFTYRPLQSQNKNGLLSFIERSGEIMANSNEIYVDDNQCIYITALRDPNNQSNYSIHSGYLTVVKLSPNQIVTQPLATSLVKINDDKKCEGYCIIKTDKLEGIKLIMSVHEDGTLNLFGVQNDGQSIHNIHKYIREQLIVDPKDKNAKKNGDANDGEDDGDSNSLKYLSDEDQDDPTGNKKQSQNHPFVNDPTYKILKNEFKLTDLSKNSTLLVDFMEKFQPLRQEADIKLEINKTKNEVVLNNEKNSVLISKNEPQEISLKCQNKQYIIVGVRIKMQMPPNTGQGIYKIKLFNREIKLLNASQEDKKIIDLSLSNLESIYSYIQNNLTFTISSQNPISNSMKISTHDIKLISIEPYGATIQQYQLKEKIEQLKTILKIKALSDKQESKQEDKENPKEVENILVNTQKILPVDFQKRRNHLLQHIDQSEVRDLINELDMLTIQILLSSQQLASKSQSETFLNANRLKEIAKQLKVMLVNPKINGQVNEYLLSSVKRTLKCILSTYQIYTSEKIIVSHPMEYTTFKTLARAEYFYNQLTEDSITLNDIYVFLQRLEKLAFNRLPLLFMIFSIYPQLLQQIIKKFLQIIKGDYDQKTCEVTINSILKIIILYYQYLKNKAAAPLSSVLSLEEVLQSESLKDAGKEAFEIFDQFLYGLQSTNLRQKLMSPTKEFQNFLKSESQIFRDELQKGQIRKFDFAFDLFTFMPKLKTQKEDKLIIEKKEEKPKLNQPSSSAAYRQFSDQFMEDISEQQDIDLNMVYGYNGDMDIQNANDANNFLYAGIDNMNEEEMMKLAIEMSLQEKNNNLANQDESESNSKADESNSNSKRMEEEHMQIASGEDSESIRIRNATENENSEERKSMNEEQNEIVKNKDMIDENEENEDDIVKINPQKISILTFDISSDFLKSMLDKLINCNKQPIGNEILLIYLYLITQTLKINSCQSPQIAYQLVHTFYQIISMVNANTLTNQNSEEAKVMIVSLKILSDVIKTPSAVSSEQKSKEQASLQSGQEISNPNVPGSTQSATEASRQKEKEQIKKNHKQMLEAYKNLREEFKKQFQIYEEKNKVSFVEKIYENFKLMLKHFESNRSSLKIEYANGEVVQVVSKVNLKPSTSEIFQSCFKNLDEFNQKLPMLMQIVDQIQFGNLMSLLFYLLLIDKNIMDQKTLQKWSILLSEILVSPTTSQISQPRTQRLLQLLMKTSTNYYDTIDRIGLHKDFETVLRIHNSSKQFKEINYDQLLVTVQSLQKILNIAQERRQNWLKFCNSKQGVIKTLYDAVLNNVKGCVEPSLKLISLYYGQTSDKK
ncbi:zinc finger protein (macronuclear) [Tetrahymena thermophila SB210]|uniref:Zinc finger protein n=1 Tax=Tetrahymena thermophila (strain SB210) TaxID=312017 RepID=Q22VW2_TETTS|nr:zinc finger protein [Tetrahymena thermophila SB210]EAR89654.2 zinc finger protein [Tetrahymena thermophila SB210]|eukprot:XP_001009900.2 zinc finger protein [Tetrahymena thermophila SB210]